MDQERNLQFVHGDIGKGRLDGRGLLGVGPFIGFHRQGVAEHKLPCTKEDGAWNCETIRTYGFLCSSARDDLCLTPVASGVDIVVNIVVVIQV